MERIFKLFRGMLHVLTEQRNKERDERKKRGFKIKELFGKIKELSNLLESEKQRADTNNDLLNQRCEEIEELKTSLRLEEEQCRDWKGSANSLGEKQTNEVVKNKGLVAQIEKMHLFEPTEFRVVEYRDGTVRLFAFYDDTDRYSACLKLFNGVDKEKNLQMASTLKDLLEENI